MLSTLRAPLDAFFDDVTVNADDSALRLNRLRQRINAAAAYGTTKLPPIIQYKTGSIVMPAVVQRSTGGSLPRDAFFEVTY